MNLKSMIERLTVLEGEQKHEDPATQAWFDGYNAAKAKDKSNNTHPKGSEESRAYDEGYNDGVQELKGRFDAVNEQDVEEGRMVKGPGGVPLDRQGNPVIPKPHMTKPSTMAVAEPEVDLDKIWFDATQIIANIFPDGDPADYFPRYCRKHGCTYDDIRASFKKHGYKDEYDYIDDMKSGDYGYDEQDVMEGSGSSLERILAAHPEAVENFKQGGDLDYDLESDLWDYYFNTGEIRNYDADASEFISQRLADELGLSEGLDANQKRVGQLGPTEKVKNNNIGKLVGANESLEIAAKPQGLRSWMKSVEQEIIAEAALDPSQIAIPSIKPSGSATTTTVKTPQASSSTPASSSMGASVIDFKDPNDPLKAALQKAIQNKSVTALGEDDLDEVISKSTPVADIIADFVHSKDSRFADKNKQERTKMALGAYYGMHPELSKKEESVMESKQAVMESTLDEVISRYPHEHKACQEGWGMDEHLYEALCDHYFKEGRIPYKIWHGPLEELRQCVEECYMQDTNPQPVVDEGLLGIDGVNIGEEISDNYESEIDEASVAQQFTIGDTVYHRNQPAKVYDMRGDTVIVTLANGDRDVWPASEVSLTRQGFLPTMKQDVKDIGRGLKGFLTGKNELGEEMMPEDLSQYTEEMEENMNESEEKWIQKAIKHPGALKKQLGVPADEKIPAGKLNAAAKKGGKLGQRARLAQTLRKLDEIESTDISEQTVAEGSHDDAMAGLQRTVDFAKQHGYRVLRSPAGKVMKFVNRALDHTLVAKVDNDGDSINVNFIDYSTGMSGNDDAAYFDHTFKQAYDQMSRQHASSEQAARERDVMEGETKDTGKGRIHKGDYGTSDDDKKAEKKGRGRPKKDSDDSAASGPKFSDAAKDFFGIAKKAIDHKKLPGKASVKHKIKDESKDAQMEGWDRELNKLLTEGLTVSTSTGQQGMPDSVSVSATDADAHNLLQIIQRAGLTGGVKSAGAAPDDAAGVISVEPVSSDEVMSNLAPEQEDDGEEAFGFLKKMLGARQTASSGYSAYKPAAGCDECGSDECECDKEEEVEEGNAFTGALAKAKADGIQPGEKIKVGGKEYPVKEEEESVEEGEWQGTGETDMAAAVAQNGDAEEDAETEKETAMAESEETCNECGGIMEEDHKCATQELNEWANSRVGGDEEQFQTEMDFMLNLISGGLNGKKTQHKHGYRFGDNPMSTPMEQDLDINSIKRLSGIK